MTVTVQPSHQEIDSGNHSGLLSQLKLGMQQLVQKHGLKPDLLARHAGSIEHCLSSACDEPVSIEQDSAANQPWGWKPMLESPDLSIGLLTVFSEQDIPLHDHPGSSGLLIVLRGKVRVQSYRMTSEGDQRFVQPLELEQSGDVKLGRGDYTYFGSSENNIHSLQAIDGDCVLFDVLFSPYQPAQRSFFMPVTPQTAAGFQYVCRLHKPHSGAMN